MTTIRGSPGSFDDVWHVQEPDFALAGPNRVHVPDDLWIIADHGASGDSLMEACSPMIAQLIRYEPDLISGPDLDPEWVRDRMMADDIDTEGERPGWMVLGWALAQGVLAEWWPEVLAMANGPEPEFDESVVEFGNDDQEGTGLVER